MRTASLAKCAEDDKHYLATQLEHNQVVDKWKRKHGFGKDANGNIGLTWSSASILSARSFMDLILPSLYDDDVLADFGARDGHVADYIFSVHAMPVTCVEILPEYAVICEKSGHKTICADVEKLPMKDGSVDWAFSHHMLEHVRNLEAAAAEITRVVKRGLFLVFPLEVEEDTHKNPSHMHYSLDPDYYIKPFEALGWKRGWFEGPGDIRQDYQVFLYR